MIACMDQDHARAVVQLVKEQTGSAPVVIISDEMSAGKFLEKFKKGTSPWLVTVRMVSEGVDIPRLRVLCYATNITSELYFHQFVGRGVRIQGIENEDCHVFVPDVAPFRQYMHQLDASVAQWQKKREVEVRKISERSTHENLFEPLGSKVTDTRQIDTAPIAIEIETLRRECTERVNKLTYTLGLSSPVIVYRHWMKDMGGRSQKIESIPELKRKKNYLDACITAGKFIGRMI
jgi:superfamily II DNA or RNA helicase